jgi:hypothetical protein
VAESLIISNISAAHPTPEMRTYVSIERSPQRHMALRQSLKLSMVLVLLYYKQAVTAFVPVASAHCSTGSVNSHHRGFL